MALPQSMILISNILLNTANHRHHTAHQELVTTESAVLTRFSLPTVLPSFTICRFETSWNMCEVPLGCHRKVCRAVSTD